jgi:LEA14-like dessication related protein
VQLLRRTLLFALALLSGCALFQEVVPKPSARIADVRLTGLNLQKADLVFDVEVTNPYAVALPLIDLTYALASGENRFLEGSVKPQQSIPAGGTGKVELPASVTFSSLLKVVQGVRPGAVLPYTADLAATVDTPLLGRLVVPVSRRGELPIPAVPKIELAALKIESFSLDAVHAVVSLNVTNTNQFVLDAAKLAVSLSLAGKAIGSSELRERVHLEAGKSGRVQIPFEFSPRAAGSAVLDVLRTSRATYRLSGAIEAQTRFGRLQMPFSSSGTAPIVR